jgi:hypothetical protein
MQMYIVQCKYNEKAQPVTIELCNITYINRDTFFLLDRYVIFPKRVIQ